MSLILDSSATLAWIFSDEISRAVQQVLDFVTKSGAIVPVIWSLEVSNSLQTAVRHGRIEAAFRDAALSDLALMNIEIDPETNNYAWSTTLHLAHKFNLTLYDAAYLELSNRRLLPLASLDKDLRAAGKALGLTLLGV